MRCDANIVTRECERDKANWEHDSSSRGSTADHVNG